MNLDQLPESLLIRIFEYLIPSQRIEIERVSSKWNFLSKCAWTKVNLIDDYLTFRDSPKGTLSLMKCDNKINADKFMALLLSRCGKYLKSIDLVLSRPIINPILLRSLAHNCHQLISVIFGFTNSCESVNVDPEITYLILNCPHLISVNLSCNTKLTGTFLAVLPIELKRLSISGCTAIGDNQIGIVADRCKNLELLDLKSCFQFSTQSLDYLCRALTNLRVLRVSVEVDDNNLYTISTFCTNLEELNLNGCEDITDAGLISLSKLSHLTQLDLDLCVQITDEGVEALTNLEHLQQIKLCSALCITDESVKKLAECCRNLRCIDLSGCENITIESIYAFYNTANYRVNRLSLVVSQTYFSVDDDDDDEFRLELEKFSPELKITFD